MMIWKFYEFVHGVVSDRGIISTDMAVGPQAELDVILSEDLGIKQKEQWGWPSFKSIGGGLDEIRFELKNVQYRIYGSFGPDQMTYRLWLVATKARKRRGKQATDPPEAIEKARERKRKFELHREGRLRLYDPTGTN